MLSAARRGLVVLMCAATWATSALAAVYPERPITMLVPAGAGGTNDAVARVVAQKLGEVLQGTVVVENRPGAGGNIGTASAAKVQPNGYTLLMNVSSAMAINPDLYKSPGFDPVKDFAPISLVKSVPNVLVVSPSFPAQSMKELIAAARVKPKAYQFGSAGNGTLPHLMGEMLNPYAGIELQHIPYRSIAAALTDVIGSEISMAFATPDAVNQHTRSNRLVPLGVEIANGSPQQLADLLKEDLVRWEKIVKQSGARVD